MADTQMVALVRQAVDRLIAGLEGGESAQLKAYLSAMGRFGGYSLGNLLLINWQCPQVSHVTGYRTWQRLGRQVRNGEHGIRILAPIVYRDENEAGDAGRAIAFAVCEAIGLDANVAAANCIRLYDGERKTLLASLDRIQRTAAEIMAALFEPGSFPAGTGEPLVPAVQRPAA